MSGTGSVAVTGYSAVGYNQYDVAVQFRIAFDWGGYNYEGASYSVTCDGSTQSGSTTFSVSSGGGTWVWTTIANRTFRVTMPTSGAAKTISLSAGINTGVNPSYISASNSYTLPARTWQWTVSYNANGGSGAPSSQTKTAGTTLTLSSTVPTKSGYTFLGWATSQANANAGTISYYAGSSYTSNSGATLYAVWGVSSRIVTYNANGGENAPDTQVKEGGVNLTLTSDIPTRDKYIFYKWNTKADGTGTYYDSGSVYSVDEDVTLYAIWEIDKNAYTPNKIKSIDAYVDGNVLSAIVNTSDVHTHKVEWYVSNFPYIIGDVVEGQSGLTLKTNVDQSLGDIYVRAYAVSRYGIKSAISDFVKAASRNKYRFRFKTPSDDYVYSGQSLYPSSSTYPIRPDMPQGFKIKDGVLKFELPIDIKYPDSSVHPDGSVYPEEF